MKKVNSFHADIHDDLEKFLKSEREKYDSRDLLRIDLHCHDYNSNVPDEKLGRILGVPETWLPSDKLIDSLKFHGCDTFTITNHNNARSCYEMQDKGHDILTAAEFSVIVPDYARGIHVLTYGFTPQQEVRLNKLRDNLYKFQAYAVENDIPTVWAHPLYHYKSKEMPDMAFFEKMVLIFERFEVMNGQRDTWQNMLIRNYLAKLTPAMMQRFSKKHGIIKGDYKTNPSKIVYTGGSDEHMGIFAGTTGTYLYVPDLQNRLKTARRSELALEAIKEGRTSVYGSHHDSEKMAVTFIDYFCQLSLKMEDPGLMRIMLHKGDVKQKIIALLTSNAFAEISHHKNTHRFLKIFHDCFNGEAPWRLFRYFIKRAYRPVFDEALKIASIRNAKPERKPELYSNSIENIYTILFNLLGKRLKERINTVIKKSKGGLNPAQLVESIEIPSQFRSLTSGTMNIRKKRGTGLKMNEMLDGLSFPALGSAVLLAAHFTSSHVLYNTRPLLSEFAVQTGKFKHPKRLMWLTDTFEDNNGVAMVLRSFLDEIRLRDLPIDIVVCSSTLTSGENLIVLPPVATITLPFYKEQPIRIPNMMKLHKLFHENEYDRVISSTEGFMGAAALYIKKAYSVPAYFYVHTDWMTFAKKVLNFDKPNLDRVKRFMRVYYGAFDKLFVLNSDQRNEFTSNKFGFSKSKVQLTAHWVDKEFTPQKDRREELFGISDKRKVLLFAGRLSEEKGVNELPEIYRLITRNIPDVTMVIAGKGPYEEKLRKELPEAKYLGWVEHAKLPEIYSSADLLILPSKFDTFGCVVLESLSCGTPVIAYKTKGPKEIISHGKSGYLASNKNDIVNDTIKYFSDKKIRTKMKKEALKRSGDFNPDRIIDEFTDVTGLA